MSTFAFYCQRFPCFEFGMVLQSHSILLPTMIHLCACDNNERKQELHWLFLNTPPAVRPKPPNQCLHQSSANSRFSLAPRLPGAVHWTLPCHSSLAQLPNCYEWYRRKKSQKKGMWKKNTTHVETNFAFFPLKLFFLFFRQVNTRRMFFS